MALVAFSAWDFGYSQPVIITPIIIAPADTFAGMAGYYQRPMMREQPTVTTPTTTERPEGVSDEGQKAPGGPASSPPARRAPNIIVW